MRARVKTDVWYTFVTGTQIGERSKVGGDCRLEWEMGRGCKGESSSQTEVGVGGGGRERDQVHLRRRWAGEIRLKRRSGQGGRKRSN